MYELLLRNEAISYPSTFPTHTHTPHTGPYPIVCKVLEWCQFYIPGRKTHTQIHTGLGVLEEG